MCSQWRGGAFVRRSWLRRVAGELQVFAGNHGPARSPEELARAFKALVQRLPAPKGTAEQLLLDGLLAKSTLRALTAFHPHDPQAASPPVGRPRATSAPFASAEGGASPARDAELPAAVQRFLRERLDDRLTMSAISRHFGVSETRLRGLFADRTGMSVHQFLTQLRLRRAIELLATTDIKVEAIARLVGYRSKASLYRHLKESTNRLPRQIRSCDDRGASPAT
jgi:AraC-like DNA-binding protein